MKENERSFEIYAEGCTYHVERCTSKHKLYRLSGKKGSYLIAKDYYGVWVELDRKVGSADISLSVIGQLIDSHQNASDIFPQLSANNLSR